MAGTDHVHGAGLPQVLAMATNGCEEAVSGHCSLLDGRLTLLALNGASATKLLCPRLAPLVIADCRSRWGSW